MSDDRVERQVVSEAEAAFAMFGPGTTKGGRAEAGWFELGTLSDETD